MLLRLLRLSEKARTLAAAIPSYKSLIYIVVAQLVEQHYCGFSSNSTNPNGATTWSRGLHQLMVVFLMEVSAHQSLCVEFNAVIPESVIIPQIPVFSGSSVDLLFVAISQLLIDDKPRGKARPMPELQPSDPQDGNDDPSGQPRPEVAPIQTPPGNPFSPNYVAILRNM